jgi:hypothetical protein
MIITVPCTTCQNNLDWVIDTQGDSSVGMAPAGIEEVRQTPGAKPCLQLKSYNFVLESGGEDEFKTVYQEQFDAITTTLANALMDETPDIEWDEAEWEKLNREENIRVERTDS